MSKTAANDWRDWLPEAQHVVEAWESTSSRRMLSTGEATLLIQQIAHALHAAYLRGASGA